MNTAADILICLLLIGGALCFIFLIVRSRRNEITRSREDSAVAGESLEVWVCRYCGFLSLMRNDVCSWCDAPRPEDFFHRTIPRKDFAAQLKKPSPKPFTDASQKTR